VKVQNKIRGWQVATILTPIQQTMMVAFCRKLINNFLNIAQNSGTTQMQSIRHLQMYGWPHMSSTPPPHPKRKEEKKSEK
jgi:hypothetical protein